MSQMIRVTLPDGSAREVVRGTTAAQIAADIGPGLAKAALAAKIDGELRDIMRPLEEDTNLSLVTSRDEADALELFRHDFAHVLAEAVQNLFPGTQITFGPSTGDGFYYDFAPTAEHGPFRDDELPLIEEEMRKIIAADLPLTREVWERDKLIAKWAAEGETFKAEWAAELPQGEELTVYRSGEGWMDMCRGPHLASTGKLDPAAFKLTRVSGAYWRGDQKNAQLSRIYGTGWLNKKQLAEHLLPLDEAGQAKYRENMFVIPDEVPNIEDEGPIVSDDAEWMALKPMNCPAHVLIFRQGMKSYRDLPLRMAEMGCCHRNEPHGALHGIMRVRQFTQDDGHIFCREDQIVDEVRDFCALLDRVYKQLGFEKYAVKLALRPDMRFGTEEMWDKAEAELREAVERAGMATEEYGWEELPGEGAFYAPKLEFHLTDAIGRTWQCGTIQSDRVMPERLDASYIGEDGERHRPVMLHRAILGTYERFIGILIEHFAGRFPTWLAPVQAVVATIVSDADAYAKDAVAQLVAAGIRAESDVRNEKINYKVREHSLAKVPYLLVVGNREAEEGTVAIRTLGQDGQRIMPLAEAIAMLKGEATPPDLRG